MMIAFDILKLWDECNHADTDGNAIKAARAIEAIVAQDKDAEIERRDLLIESLGTLLEASCKESAQLLCEIKSLKESLALAQDIIDTEPKPQQVEQSQDTILADLVSANMRGVCPPQNWTHRAIDEIARLTGRVEQSHAQTSPDSVRDLPPLPESLDEVKCMIRGEQDYASVCDDYYSQAQMRKYALDALQSQAPSQSSAPDSAKDAAITEFLLRLIQDDSADIRDSARLLYGWHRADLAMAKEPK